MPEQIPYLPWRPGGAQGAAAPVNSTCVSFLVQQQSGEFLIISFGLLVASYYWKFVLWWLPVSEIPVPPASERSET